MTHWVVFKSDNHYEEKTKKKSLTSIFNKKRHFHSIYIVCDIIFMVKENNNNNIRQMVSGSWKFKTFPDVTVATTTHIFISSFTVEF